MFFFKEVQTVRQRRGAIANLELAYNSRNASIIRRKGNFGDDVITGNDPKQQKY